MNEPKENLKIMAAAAGVGHSMQTTFVPQNSGDTGGDDPPPPPEDPVSKPPEAPVPPPPQEAGGD